MKVGDRVRVTDAGWAHYEMETGAAISPNERTCKKYIVAMPAHSPFDNSVALSWPPLFWFLEEEVEVVDITLDKYGVLM